MSNIYKTSLISIFGIILLIALAAGAYYFYESKHAQSPTGTQPSSSAISSATATSSTPQQQTTAPATSSTAVPTTTYSPTATQSLPKNVVVTGGGSSFINPQMQAWINVFVNMHNDSNIVINYQSIGSGAGESKLLDGSLDFSGTDVPISNQSVSKLKAANASFLQIPIIAGATAIVYNVPEWNDSSCGPIKLTGEVLADIYMGKIIYWDDSRIKELQSAQCASQLPHKEIIGVHRSDGSGTTALFTTYLSMLSSEWNSTVGHGYTVQWPRDSMGFGLGAKGSEGVSATVKSTPYSLSYVEYGYAISLNLSMALLKNKYGNFVLPNTTTVSSALNSVDFSNIPKQGEYWGDYAAKLLNTGGQLSYPIVGTPIITLRLDIQPSKLQVLQAFLIWALTEGQKEKYIVQGYLPLPSQFAQVFVDQLKAINVK